MREMSMVEMQEVNGGIVWWAGLAVGAGLSFLLLYPAWKAIKYLKKIGLWPK